MEPIEPPRSTRLVLLAGILAGFGNFVVTPLVSPGQVMLASNVYLHAAEALLSGGNLYETTPPDLPQASFLYPPIVVLVFLPHALLGGVFAAFAIQTLLNVASAVGIAVVAGRALQRRNVALATRDWLLLGGFALASAHSAITVINGQVTLWLAFGVAVGFDALERDREALAGAAFGAAALIKVFPAALGLWLLRQRAWRGVAAALVTGLGGLLLGALVLGPDLTVTYFEDVLLARYQEETFDGRPDPAVSSGGVHRQLAAILGVGSPLTAVLAFAIVGPLVGALYRRLDTDERRLAAMVGTVAGILLFFPLQPLYFPLLAFPLLVLLYLLAPGLPRRVLLAGTLVSFVRTDLSFIEGTVTAVGLPAGVEGTVLGLAESFFVFIQPPTVGLWLLLGACLLVHYPE